MSRVIFFFPPVRRFFSFFVFSFFPVLTLHPSQAASVAILPSALFLSDFRSVQVRHIHLFQQVLLPDYRPRLPSLGWELGQDLVAVT